MQQSLPGEQTTWRIGGNDLIFIADKNGQGLWDNQYINIRQSAPTRKATDRQNTFIKQGQTAQKSEEIDRQTAK